MTALASPRPGVLTKTDDRLGYLEGEAYRLDQEIVRVGAEKATEAIEVGLNGDQGIATGSTVDITWESEDWTNGSFSGTTDGLYWDNAGETARITTYLAGLFHVRAQVSWPSGSSGQRQVLIRLNGSTIAQVNATTSAIEVQQVSKYHKASVGDYFTVAVFQNSGSTLSIASADCHFSATRVSA